LRTKSAARRGHSRGKNALRFLSRSNSLRSSFDSEADDHSYQSSHTARSGIIEPTKTSPVSAATRIGNHHQRLPPKNGDVLDSNSPFHHFDGLNTTDSITTDNSGSGSKVPPSNSTTSKSRSRSTGIGRRIRTSSLSHSATSLVSGSKNNSPSSPVMSELQTSQIAGANKGGSRSLSRSAFKWMKSPSSSSIQGIQNTPNSNSDMQHPQRTHNQQEAQQQYHPSQQSFRTSQNSSSNHGHISPTNNPNSNHNNKEDDSDSDDNVNVVVHSARTSGGEARIPSRQRQRMIRGFQNVKRSLSQSSRRSHGSRDSRVSKDGSSPKTKEISRRNRSNSSRRNKSGSRSRSSKRRVRDANDGNNSNSDSDDSITVRVEREAKDQMTRNNSSRMLSFVTQSGNRSTKSAESRNRRAERVMQVFPPKQYGKQCNKKGTPPAPPASPNTTSARKSIIASILSSTVPSLSTPSPSHFKHHYATPGVSHTDSHDSTDNSILTWEEEDNNKETPPRSSRQRYQQQQYPSYPHNQQSNRTPTRDEGMMVEQMEKMAVYVKQGDEFYNRNRHCCSSSLNNEIANIGSKNGKNSSSNKNSELMDACLSSYGNALECLLLLPSPTAHASATNNDTSQHQQTQLSKIDICIRRGNAHCRTGDMRSASYDYTLALGYLSAIDSVTSRASTPTTGSASLTASTDGSPTMMSHNQQLLSHSPLSPYSSPQHQQHQQQQNQQTQSLIQTLYAGGRLHNNQGIIHLAQNNLTEATKDLNESLEWKNRLENKLLQMVHSAASISAQQQNSFRNTISKSSSGSNHGSSHGNSNHGSSHGKYGGADPGLQKTLSQLYLEMGKTYHNLGLCLLASSSTATKNKEAKIKDSSKNAPLSAFRTAIEYKTKGSAISAVSIAETYYAMGDCFYVPMLLHDVVAVPDSLEDSNARFIDTDAVHHEDEKQDDETDNDSHSNNKKNASSSASDSDNENASAAALGYYSMSVTILKNFHIRRTRDEQRRNHNLMLIRSNIKNSSIFESSPSPSNNQRTDSDGRNAANNLFYTGRNTVLQMMANALHCIATIHCREGNFDKGIDCAQESIKFRNEITGDTMMTTSQNEDQERKQQKNQSVMHTPKALTVDTHEGNINMSINKNFNHRDKVTASTLPTNADCSLIITSISVDLAKTHHVLGMAHACKFLSEIERPHNHKKQSSNKNNNNNQSFTSPNSLFKTPIKTKQNDSVIIGSDNENGYDSNNGVNNSKTDLDDYHAKKTKYNDVIQTYNCAIEALSKALFLKTKLSTTSSNKSKTSKNDLSLKEENISSSKLKIDPVKLSDLAEDADPAMLYSVATIQFHMGVLITRRYLYERVHDWDTSMWWPSIVHNGDSHQEGSYSSSDDDHESEVIDPELDSTGGGSGRIYLKMLLQPKPNKNTNSNNHSNNNDESDEDNFEINTGSNGDSFISFPATPKKSDNNDNSTPIEEQNREEEEVLPKSFMSPKNIGTPVRFNSNVSRLRNGDDNNGITNNATLLLDKKRQRPLNEAVALIKSALFIQKRFLSRNIDIGDSNNHQQLFFGYASEDDLNKNYNDHHNYLHGNGIARALHALGWINRCLKKYDESANQYQEALSLYRRTSKKEHVVTARTTAAMSATSKDKSSHKRNIVMMVTNDVYIDALNSLGLCHVKRADYSSAMACFNDVLAEIYRHLGLQHQTIEKDTVSSSPTAVYYSQHDYSMMVPSSWTLRWRPPTTNASAATPPPLPSTGGNRKNLTNSPATPNTAAAATAPKLKNSTNPCIQHNWFEALRNIGDLHRDRHHYDDALVAYSNALAIQRNEANAAAANNRNSNNNNKPQRQQFPSSLAVADVFNSVGNINFKKGDYRRAMMSYVTSLKMKRMFLVCDHTSLLTTLNNLGHAHYKMGVLDSAFDAYREALRLRKARLLRDGRRNKIWDHGDDNINNNMFESIIQKIIKQHQKHQHRQHQDQRKAALTHIRSSHLNQNDRKALSDSLGNIAATFNNIALIHQDNGDVERAIEAYQSALSVRKAQPLYQPAAVAVTAETIGLIQFHRGQYQEAMESFSEALEVKKATNGGGNGEVANTTVSHTLNNMANCLFSSGRLDESMIMYREALDIKRKRLGEDHIDVANTHNNIGNVFYSKGEYKKALAPFEEALRIKKIQLGNNDLNVAATLANIGDAKSKLNKMDDALKAYNEALSIQRSNKNSGAGSDGNNNSNSSNVSGGVQNDSHQQQQTGIITIATLLSSIGRVHQKKGNFPPAVAMFLEELQIREDFFGKDHTSIGATYTNLGRSYYKLGSIDDAITAYKESLRIKKKRLVEVDLLSPGSISPKNASGAASLQQKVKIAMTGGKLDEVAGATDSPGQPLSPEMKSHSDALGEVSTTLNCIGLAYQDKMEFDKALNAYKASVKYKTLQVGKDNLDIAVTTETIGICYFNKGDYINAIKSFEESLRVKQLCLGLDHVDVATTLNNIGNVHYTLGNSKAAMKSYGRALELKRLLLGPDHLDVATMLNNIGSVYAEERSDEKAMEYYLEALKVRRKKLGDDNLTVATTQFNLGEVYAKTGYLDKALECFRETLRIRSIKLGKYSTEIVRVLDSMARIFLADGELERSLEYFADSYRVTEKHFGSDSMEAALTLENIAIVRIEQGLHDIAMKALEEVLRIKRSRGADASMTTTRMRSIQEFCSNA